MRPDQTIRRYLKAHRWKPARLAVVAATVALGAGLSWAEPQFVFQAREWVWDQMVRARPRPYDPALKVRIVDIDEASLAEWGQWPWPRARLARLVEKLAAYKTKAVAFDVIFAEPDRTSLSRVFESLEKDLPDYRPPMDKALLAAQPDNDAMFAHALDRVPVVLGLGVTEQVTPNGMRPLARLPRIAFERRRDQRYLGHFAGAISALPVLQEQAAANAFIDLRVDADGITRRAPLLFKVHDRTVPSLAAALVHAVHGGAITAKTRRPGLKAVTIGDIAIPTDRYGQMRLYDSGTKQARYISANDVLHGTAPAARLRDAVVIVGTDAAGLNDLRLTPLDRWTPGMETHAQLVEQILSRTFLDRPDIAGTAEPLATLAVGALLLASVALGWRRAPPWAIAVAAAAGFAGFAWVAFAEYRLLYDAAVPAATVLAAAAFDRFLLVLELRHERGAVRNAFARYLAPAVVEQLARDPDRLKLGGERREMSFLFCDIRGFTALSEQFAEDPEGLTQLINRFLTPMTDAIMRHGGTIDKYIGDCVMAFWNAPLDDPDHAAHACEAALAMQVALAALNAEPPVAAPGADEPVTIRAGIGLNTGSCIVGNVGSDQRFDYSVLGDAVNLASRLEGQSKTYGVDILVGEATRAAAPGFAALEVDLVAVVGRDAPVRVYALLGDRDMRDSDAFRRLDTAQADMLAAWRGRQWERCGALAEDARAIARTGGWALDTLYDLYAARAAAYAASPPPTDWDGVYAAATK